MDAGDEETFTSILKADIAAKKRKILSAAEKYTIQKQNDTKVKTSSQSTVMVKEPIPESPTLSPSSLITSRENKSTCSSSKPLEAELSKQTPPPPPTPSSPIIPSSSAMECELIDSKMPESQKALLICSFLKKLLEEQHLYLQSRSEEEKDSVEGRQAMSAYSQSKSSLQGLFKLLKRGGLSADVLLKLADICCWMQQREYVKANDTYLRLAIGNAPWPIGVTAVGIHERSAQERIKGDQIAHVLNDEATRKWLQSVKRLMTFCQMRYPASSRTKMVISCGFNFPKHPYFRWANIIDGPISF